MYFIFYLFNTLLRLRFSFASPKPAAVQIPPPYGLSPINLTAIKPADCNRIDTHCAGKSRLKDPTAPINDCPEGSYFEGSYCEDSHTKVSVCRGDDDGAPYPYPEACPIGMRCVQNNYIAVCEPEANTFIWSIGYLGYPSGSRSIFSENRNTKSWIWNNYWGPNGAPVNVSSTSFVGQPHQGNEGIVFSSNTASSTLIDWGYDDSVMIKVEGFRTTNCITVVTFLVPPY